ncbi:aminoacyl-histidine dipeptidase [Lelliottia amnigena]|nr:aminoacyl-histidine dipeptidase [Lelliottia amnigena]
MALVRETYQRLFNSTPNIQVIHAGLECGLFKKPYPDMDMVSIGADHYRATTPRMSRFILKAWAITGRC